MWYYISSEDERVPVNKAQFIALIKSGVIHENTPMWRAGLDDWIRASEAHPKFFQKLESKPRKASPSRSDDVEYRILGDDMQLVEVILDPGETIIAEAGAMNYIEEGVTFEAKFGDGSTESPKGLMGVVKSVGSRVLTGESLFMTHFTHEGSGKKCVAFAAPYPGKIIPIDLREVGGTLLCQKDAFLCAARGTEVSIALNKKIGTGIFGGEGFILQKLAGDGLAFIHVGGTVVKKELRGETLRVDTGCLAAFDPSLEYGIERSGNLKSMFFGGEGFFLATLSGYGTVYLQSMPFSRLADRIIGTAQSLNDTVEGSIVGGFLGN